MVDLLLLKKLAVISGEQGFGNADVIVVNTADDGFCTEKLDY